MSEQLFTVTYTNFYDKTLKCRHLTFKRANGLARDFHEWGYTGITIMPEQSEANLANRHAWQCIAITVCILGFIIAILTNFLLG